MTTYLHFFSRFPVVSPFPSSLFITVFFPSLLSTYPRPFSSVFFHFLSLFFRLTFSIPYLFSWLPFYQPTSCLPPFLSRFVPAPLLACLPDCLPSLTLPSCLSGTWPTSLPRSPVSVVSDSIPVLSARCLVKMYVRKDEIYVPTLYLRLLFASVITQPISLFSGKIRWKETLGHVLGSCRRPRGNAEVRRCHLSLFVRSDCYYLLLMWFMFFVCFAFADRHRQRDRQKDV